MQANNTFFSYVNSSIHHDLGQKLWIGETETELMSYNAIQCNVILLVVWFPPTQRPYRKRLEGV